MKSKHTAASSGLHKKRRQEFRKRLLQMESLEDRRMLAVDGLAADGLVPEGEPTAVSDVALTLPIQDQLLSVLGSLDQAAGSLAFNSTLNRDIPGTGRSLNDLLDSADGSVDRDWGDFIQFEQVAATYFSAFDPSHAGFDPANAGASPSAFGLRDAIQTQIDVGIDGGFVGRSGMPALSVFGGSDDAGKLQFQILLAADANTPIAPELSGLGDVWNDLHVDFNSGVQVVQHTTADIDLKFGVGLQAPGGVNPYFSLDNFAIATAVDADGDTLGYSIGSGIVTGDIVATAYTVGADVNISMPGAGPLADRIQVTAAASNPLNIDLLFDDPSLLGSTIADATAKFSGTNVLDTSPIELDPISNLSSLDLNVSGQPLIDGLEVLADWIDDAVINDPQLATKLPLVNRSLAEVLAASGATRLFSGTAVTNVTSPVVIDQSNQFTVTLNKDVAKQGIAIGNSARFLATTGEHFSATVVAVSGKTVTLSYPASRGDIPDTTNPSFSFNVGGKHDLLNGPALDSATDTTLFGDLLRAALERYQQSDSVPSLGQVLSDLAGPLGITMAAITLSGTTLSLTSTFSPAALDIPVRMDFGSAGADLAGLKIDKSGDFILKAEPTFTLPLEVDLNPATMASDERVRIKSDAAHEVSIKLSATLNDPSIVATLGFMKTVLQESSSNSGVVFDTTIGASIENVGGTAISQLTSGNQAFFKPAVSGSYNIPGLSLTPDLTGTTGEITVSTSGATSFSDFSALSGLFSPTGIVVAEVTEFEDFSDLSPADMLSMVIQLGDSIDSVMSKLDVPGGIPFVKDSISSVAGFLDQTENLASQLFDKAQLQGKNEISATTGVLTSDASFVLRIADNDPVFVSLHAADTSDNHSIDDLYTDINQALANAGLGDKVEAVRATGTDGNANKLSMRLKKQSVGSAFSVSTLQITGPAPAPSSGRIGQDVSLNFTIETKNSNDPLNVAVTLPGGATTSNATLANLVRDLNTAMVVDIGDGSLLSDLIVAQAVDGHIRLAALDSTTQSLSVSGGSSLGLNATQAEDVNPANNVLGLGVSQVAVAKLRVANVQDLVAVLNEVLPILNGTPTSTSLVYDSAHKRITFGLDLSKTYSKSIDLDFSKAINLGFADLNLAGGADATFEANAALNLKVGLDLNRAAAGESLTLSTPLTSLNGGNGIAIQVAVTGGAAPNISAAGPLDLKFAIHRFGVATPENVNITLTAGALSDNASAEDLAFDIGDALKDAGQPIRATMNGDKLILIAEDSSINQLTILTGTADAFGFTAGQVSDQADLDITLADGSQHSIALDGAQTIGDVQSKIQAPFAGKIAVNLVEDRLQIVDLTTPVDEKRMSIAAAKSSFGTSSAAGGLGILGATLDADSDLTPDYDDSTTIEGEHLLRGSVADQFFIDTDGSKVSVIAKILANNIDLTASLGLLDLGIKDGKFGDGSTTGFSIAAMLSLPDNGDSDGLLRLSDFGQSGFKSALAGIAPIFTYGGQATLPLKIPLLPAEAPVITLTLEQGTNNRPDFAIDAPNVSDLIGDFKSLSLGDLAGMLRLAVDMLRESDIAGLNTDIPLINQSPNDLLSFTDGLLAASEKLLAGVDIDAIKGLRDQFKAAIDLVDGTPEQLAKLTTAFSGMSRNVDPVQTFTLRLTDGAAISYTTGVLSSEATALDIQAALTAALGQPDKVTVTGKAGGPYEFTFDKSLGNVTLDSASESGLILQLETTIEGVANTTDEVQTGEFLKSSGLVASLLNLKSTLDELTADSVDVSALTGLIDQMTGGVVSTDNLSEFLTSLLKDKLGSTVVVGVEFIDADSVKPGFQATLKLHLKIKPTVTKNVGFDLSLGDFGPLSIGSDGNINITFDGDINLDLGYNFASLTPYVFDTTNFAITAKIKSNVGVSAGIGGFQAGLTGTATLGKVGDPDSSASIGVSVKSATPTDGNTIGAIPIRQLKDGGLKNTFAFNLDGEVNADLDASLAGTNIADAIQVNYDLSNAISGGTPTIDYSNLTTGVNNYLNSLTDLSSMNLDQLISGTRTVLNTVQSGLQSDLLTSLPLIGDGVDLSSSFVGKLQSMVDKLQTLVDSTDDSVDRLVGEIQTLIYNALGPNGAKMLALEPLYNDDPTIDNAIEKADSRDVEVSLTPFSSANINNMEFSINLHLKGHDSIDANFDLGLDAVAFEFNTSGGVELAWDYDFNFGFGISLRDGFFFNLNPNINRDSAGFSDGTAGKVNARGEFEPALPEIMLNAEVNLKDGTKLNGELFFLNLNAQTNKLEDYNRDGILNNGLTGIDPATKLPQGPKLNEVLDQIDYNRDGDMNDLLTEVDGDHDGRLSRGTGLKGQIFLDFNKPGGSTTESNRLTLGDLKRGSIFSAGIRTEAYVDMALSADTDASSLPKLSADLTVDWGISYTTTAGFVGGLPDVAFHDVSLDLGSFFQSIAGPAFGIFEKYLEPVRPVIDFLKAEVPGFSDLSTKTGGPKITFLDLGAYAGGSSSQVAKAKKVLDTLDKILGAVETIKKFADADGLIINFGDFQLTGTPTPVPSESLGSNPAVGHTVGLAHASRAGSVSIKAGGVIVNSKDYDVIYGRDASKNPITTIKFLKAQVGAIVASYSYTANKLDVTDPKTHVKAPAAVGGADGKISNDVFNKIGTGNTKAKNTMSTLKKLNRSADDGGFGLKIPLLSDPSNIFKLFTGETADIIQWDIPALDLSLPFSARFGPLIPLPPVFAKVGGSLDAKLDFSIGFDTRGISDTGNFLDGLYFGDRAQVSTGDDIDEVAFSLSVNAGVGVDIGLASVYLVGGARADLAFNWNDIDGDGKLYLDELASLAVLKSSPNIPGVCVFDAHGSVSAEVKIDWSVGVSIFAISGSIPIVDINLLNFNYTCTDAINIATLGPDNTLVLNAGPNASARASGADGNDAESFAVTQISDHVVQVTYDLPVNGSTVKLRKTFNGVQSIYFNGGGGNDSLSVDPSVTLPVTLIGGAGADTLTGGSGRNTFAGGSGDDVLTSGAANDTYLFEDNWGVDTIVDAGGTNDKFDFSAVTSNITATLGSLQVTSGANRVQGNSSGAPVEGIEDIVAGTGVDTLISTAVVGSGSFNTWTLNGVGSGNINGLLQFSRFENLTGGAPDDRFVFTGGSLTGAIDGGGRNRYARLLVRLATSHRQSRHLDSTADHLVLSYRECQRWHRKFGPADRGQLGCQLVNQRHQ